MNALAVDKVDGKAPVKIARKSPTKEEVAAKEQQRLLKEAERMSKRKAKDTSKAEKVTAKKADVPKADPPTKGDKKKSSSPVGKPEVPVGCVALSDICTRLNVEPRQARIRLRAAYAKGGKGLPEKVGDAWVFNNADVKRVDALVKPVSKKAK